jgi:hypothetical protein
MPVSHPSDVKRLGDGRRAKGKGKPEGSRVRVLFVFLVISGLISGVISGLGISANVSARSGFDPVMYKQLKLGDQVGTVLEKSSCQLCHLNARGGAPWNPFGLAVGKFRAKRLPIDQAVFEALKLEADVDKDGFSDALEVFVGTMPGDANSKPLETPEALKSKFDAAGGVMRYVSSK